MDTSPIDAPPLVVRRMGFCRRLRAFALAIPLCAIACPNSAWSQTGSDPATKAASANPVFAGSIITSTGVIDGTSPVYAVNLLVGAGRFYNEGFLGFNAIVGNVEAGYIWNGHETLGQVTTYVQDTVSPGTQTGQFDRHATCVGGAIAGRPPVGQPLFFYQLGIAPFADLWSGAVATAWSGTPYSASFDVNLNTFVNPYKQMMVTGVNGKTVDVVNSSWGFDQPLGVSDDYDRAIDALINLSGKTFVTSAGNSGPGLGSTQYPAASYNRISVAALTGDSTNPPYGTVADFSSRGPGDVINPVTHQLKVGVRATVDIAAPGTDLVLPYYGGQTGGNSPTLGTPDDNNTANSFYSIGVAGTSFSAPIVAGGATLVADAARTIFGPSTKALDGRIVKAVLLNSATKIAGWNNGQISLANGVIATSQSLDYASGAGALNLDRAFDQLTAGTTDVPGLGGGKVQPIGWDYGQVHFGSTVDYPINQKLVGGSTLTVTLDWFIERTIDLATNETAESTFNDLDLQVWKAVNDVPTTLVAISDSQYNNVEHLSFQLPSDDEYLLRVTFFGNNWNLSGVPMANLTEDFGLAWSGTAVPEPSSLLLAFLALAALRITHSLRSGSRPIHAQ